MTFTPNIPTASMSLGTSRIPIVNNFTALFNSISVNHYSPSAANDGKHRYVQMPVLSTGFPTNPAGQLSLYTKDVSGRSTIYYKKDNSSTQWQLTGIDPSNAATGYTYLPGGLLMQWGSFTGALASGATKTVTFPVAFDATAYSVQLIMTKSSGNTDSNFLFIVDGQTTSSQFKVGINGNSNKGYFWLAVGSKA